MNGYAHAPIRFRIMTEQEWRACRKTATVEAKGPFTDPNVIDTLEGQFEVDEDYIEEHGGFYLMRGADGEVYPCAMDIFNKTYEFVDGRATANTTES